MGSVAECEPSELNIFGPVALQKSIIGSDEIEYSNINSLDNATTIEFNIVNKSMDTYLDLTSTTLFMQIQLVKADGSKYKLTDTVDKRETQPSFVNNMLSSIVKSVSVSLNGTVVSNCNLYSYKHYLDTILNYGTEAANSQLTISGFFKDEPEKFDKLDDSKEANSGAKIRRTVLLDSALVNLYGKLDCDALNTSRLLLNSVDMKITLNLNEPAFYLLETGTSNLIIHKSSILIRHCKINEGVLLRHNQILNSNKKATYPFSRSDIKSFLIPSGIQSISVDNIINGVLPDNLVVAFITNEAFNGSRSKNCFNFQPHELYQFTLFINGIPLSGHPLEINKYNYTRYTQAYRSLFLNTQSLYKDNSSMINYVGFRDGYFIIVLNLTPTLELTGGMCTSILRQGTVKIDLKFHDATKSTLNMLVYSETPAMFSVDKNRNVEVDY